MTDQKQVLPESHPFMGGCPENAQNPDKTFNCSGNRGVGAFTKWNLAVLQRKENEKHSTGRVDANRMADPEISLTDYINGESIVDQDLVAWVSYGMIHLPIAEDKPMTNMVHMGIIIKPSNFDDENDAFKQPVDIFVNPQNKAQTGELSPTRTAEVCVDSTAKDE